MSEGHNKGLLQPGDLLNGAYRIQNLIAKGGTGEVYKAVNVVAERQVAIKILQEQYARDENFLALMRRELSQDISHPAVVRYFDLFYTEDFNGLHFLVMEYIEGPSLAMLMREGPGPMGFLLRVGRQILKGLAACHANSIYHRDISPDNILLRRPGDPDSATLIDFGIARDVRPDARTVVGGGFAGKYEYAAPEQLENNVDERSDLYSLGATLLAAAKGRTPDIGENILEVARAKRQPLDTEGIAPPLRELIDRLTAPDPEERPQSAEEALAMFESALASAGPQPGGERSRPRPGPTPPPSRREGARPDSRRRPEPPSRRDTRRRKKSSLGPALAMLALVGAAAGGIYYVVASGPPTATPYRFEAARGEDGTVFAEGHAPDSESLDKIEQALRNELGGAVEEGALIKARGAPNKNWAEMALGMIGFLGDLDHGRASIEDGQARLEGLAPDENMVAVLTRSAESHAEFNGYEISIDLTALEPPGLDMAVVADAILSFEDCGRLDFDQPRGGVFDEGETIALRGQISDAARLDDLIRALEGLGDSQNPVDASGVTAVNPSVCGLYALLPQQDDPDLEIRFTSNKTGARVADGVFEPQTDAPVVDLFLADSVEGRLHAVVLDNEFNLVNLRPGVEREEDRIEALGDPAPGGRVLRLLYPLEEYSRKTLAIGFSEPYGTLAVIAIATDSPLFDDLRPDIEDTRDFIDALQAALNDLSDEERENLRLAKRLIRVDTGGSP